MAGAPQFNCPVIAAYPSLTPKMAMKLGSKYKFSEVEMRHWEQFASAAGLSVAQTRRRILELAKLLPVAAQKLRKSPDHGFFNNRIIEQITGLIEQRSALTIQRLSTPASGNR